MQRTSNILDEKLMILNWRIIRFDAYYAFPAVTIFIHLLHKNSLSIIEITYIMSYYFDT